MSTKNDAVAPLALDGYEVLVCVCGGIAAYKVAGVVSALAQRGAGVTVAMTESATRLVAPMTFQALSGRRVLTTMWEEGSDTDVRHIRVTESADLVLIAPATANMIGKMVGGIADDLVSTLVISAASPVVVVPAMNERMWANPIVASNVAVLKQHGYVLVGPAEGWLACRGFGPGRMAEPEDILEAVVSMLKNTEPKNV